MLLKLAATMVRGTAGGKFYAVRRGRIPGIYRTWADCEAQVVMTIVLICRVQSVCRLWQECVSSYSTTIGLDYPPCRELCATSLRFLPKILDMLLA